MLKNIILIGLLFFSSFSNSVEPTTGGNNLPNMGGNNLPNLIKFSFTNRNVNQKIDIHIYKNNQLKFEKIFDTTINSDTFRYNLSYLENKLTVLTYTQDSSHGAISYIDSTIVNLNLNKTHKVVIKQINPNDTIAILPYPKTIIPTNKDSVIYNKIPSFNYKLINITSNLDTIIQDSIIITNDTSISIDTSTTNTLIDTTTTISDTVFFWNPNYKCFYNYELFNSSNINDSNANYTELKNKSSIKILDFIKIYEMLNLISLKFKPNIDISNTYNLFSIYDSLGRNIFNVKITYLANYINIKVIDNISNDTIVNKFPKSIYNQNSTNILEINLDNTISISLNNYLKTTTKYFVLNNELVKIIIGDKENNNSLPMNLYEMLMLQKKE